MSSRRRRRTGQSFVMLGRRMLRSPEWKALSAAAKLAYIHLKAKYNGSNSGSIRLYYSELKGLRGLSSAATVAKAFKELETKGWITRTRFGGLFRHFNNYGLTGRYDEYVSPGLQVLAEYKKTSLSEASEKPLTIQSPKSRDIAQGEKLSA